MGKENVDKYIADAPSDQQKILQSLRRLIHKTVPDANEEIKWGQPVFSSSDNFAYLKSAKNYATLGFFNFSELNDPDNILEGSGKRMRHVKIRSADNIKPGLFKKWFKTAAGN